MSYDDSTHDELLMQAFQERGDMSAFNRLYQRYHSQLYRYLCNRVSQKVDGDELFQDIWAKVIKAKYVAQSGASFRTWLYTIARNRLTDYFRQRNISLVDMSAEEEAVDDQGPDEKMIESQGSAAILTMVKALPQQQQDVFLLKVESGLSIQEIADIYGENSETIKSRYRYAVKRLAELLEQ